MGKYAGVGPYDSIEEIRCANRQAGGHFFEKGAEGFVDRLYDGRFFITAEYYDEDSPEKYTIRLARDDASIETVAEFHHYPSHRSAEEAIVIALATELVEVRFDPYPHLDAPAEAGADPSHFHWRAYVGELAVGERQARRSAELLAAEITG